MAKKPPKAPKSRAAKRAASPPLDLGNIPRPPSPSQQQKAAVLGLRGDAGVTKKSKKKQLSAKQKQRKEKMMEKGEAAAEKLARKQDESKQKGRTVQTRRGNWNVLNEKMQDELETALALATVHGPPKEKQSNE